jgi:hypothetical protein
MPNEDGFALIRRHAPDRVLSMRPKVWFRLLIVN